MDMLDSGLSVENVADALSVIGFEITLPSESLHRKVVEGVYNKAVDVSDDVDSSASTEMPDIIRDRVPIRFKTHMYFEVIEYTPQKPLDDLMHPVPGLAANSSTLSDPPNPNHTEPALRTLPMSSIKTYLNGNFIGTPFTDLFSFLPPASMPLSQLGSRQGLDDGTLGYYPAISVYRGGRAEANFGPEFWYPPQSENMELTEASNTTTKSTMTQQTRGIHSALRPFSSRFNEHIAEDIM